MPRLGCWPAAFRVVMLLAATLGVPRVALAQPTIPGIANADTFDPWPFLADGDLNKNLEVNIDDLVGVITNWG